MFQIINLIILCIIIFGIIKLQILLSKKQNKLLGLILPICTFILSIILCISTSFFHMTTSTQMDIITESGQLIQTENEIFPTSTNINNTSLILSIVYIFITINILTIIFLIIYRMQRKKLSTKNELKKMHISDL